MANELYMSEVGFRHFWSKLDTILDNKVEKTQAATESVLGLVIPGTGLNNAAGTISVKYSTTAQAGFAVEANDPRLSDARTPTAHTHGNISNDGKIATGTAMGNGAALVFATADGTVTKATAAFTGETTKFLREDGTFAAPPATAEMTGASAAAAGTGGTVPAPAMGQQTFYLSGAGTWVEPDWLTEHPTISVEADDTSTDTPAFGGTFQAIGAIEKDANGHVTKVTTAAITVPNAVASSSAPGLMAAADKSKLDAFQAASNYALKSDISTVYKYKGSVDNYAALPQDDNQVGDTYNLTDTGMNYVWTGTAWDALGQVFTISSMGTELIDSIMAGEEST